MAKASAAQGNVPPSKPLFARAATARGTWKTADSIRKKSMRVQDLLLQLVPRGNSTGVFQVQQDQFIRPHLTHLVTDCQVLHHSACCFHPTCYSKRPKACQWLNYFTGADSNLLLELSGHFQATLAPNLVAFLMATGVAKCKISTFLTAPYWTVTPTHTLVSEDSLKNNPQMSHI